MEVPSYGPVARSRWNGEHRCLFLTLLDPSLIYIRRREHLLKVAADYENMSDQEAFFELQDADREARIIPFVHRVMRWS
jgi:hypothetical protein